MDLINEKRRWWKLVFFLWPGQKPNYPFWEPSKKKFFFFFWIFFGRLGGYLQIFRKKYPCDFLKLNLSLIFEIGHIKIYLIGTSQKVQYHSTLLHSVHYLHAVLPKFAIEFWHIDQVLWRVLFMLKWCWKISWNCLLYESSNIAAPSRTPHFTVLIVNISKKSIWSFETKKIEF